jgi:peptide/nickel transport system permease protein
MRRTLYILLRNPLSLLGLILIALVVLSAVFADFITPFPSHVGAVVDFLNNNHAPAWPNIFGTDLVGRDLFTRTGCRWCSASWCSPSPCRSA